MGLKDDNVSDGFIKESGITCLGAVYFFIGNEFIAVFDVISRSVDEVSMCLDHPLR
jgi:hypothetical protein